MDFALATLFLILYYVRPHEWSAWLAPQQPIAKVLALGLAVVFFQAARQAEWHPLRFLRTFMRTPNDWILLVFTLWILHASGAPRETLGQFYPALGYYVLVQHALSSMRRMEGFLWVWLGLVVFIATMAVLSQYGVDPFNSQSNTQGMYKGRLSLNLSIFNNPNALAHSVVLIIPMVYFLGIWHRSLLAKELSPLLLAMPAWCLFLTQSKGGYLSGAAGALATQTFGRPRWVQLALLAVAYVGGVSALMILPRMHELESVRHDRAVQGRLLAWNFGWTSLQTLPKGLGYGRFTQFVPEYVEGRIRMRKPAHSSYVEVGAELGKTGLFLWLAVLYYSMKGLARVKGRTEQEERIRRLLFCLMVIYMASSWLTNISYRGTFFIQLGVIAAFCRHLQQAQSPSPAVSEVPATTADPGSGPATITPGPTPLGALLAAEAPESAEAAGGEGGGRRRAQTWPTWLTWRPVAWLLLDGAVVYLMYRIVLRAWLYFMLDWTGV